MKTEMRGKQLTLAALEELRTGVLTGKRVELPSAHRQHLERGSPMISEVTFDARHRPISTNVSRHFKPLRMLAESSEVKFHTFLGLKKSTQKAGPTALLVTLDTASKLSVHGLEGDVLLDSFDLGHGEGRAVTHLVLSPKEDNHFVVSADDAGTVRVHDLKITAQKGKKTDKSEDDDDEPQESKKKQQQQQKKLQVATNFSCTFTVPPAAGGEARKLTALLPIERGSQTYFVTGDSLGGMAVFFRNGTLKGRVKVTEDPGGVQGMLRSQGQMILFYSSHSFGFFSAAQIDVQYPPCSGWNSPLFDIALDPSSSSSRVILALADGDVIVFSTQSGKNKACDLTLKFPHVSTLPFKLHAFRGHIMALPTPLPDMPRQDEYTREIFFFNLAAMDAGYGLAPSRAVALQASFKPKQPDSLALRASSSPQERGKAQVAIRYAGDKGVELFELNLKTPTSAKAAGGSGGGGEGGGGGNDWSSWLNWFPKIGVFGIALIGVVIWNVRKVTSQQKHDRSSSSNVDDFDDELFRERLRERREKRDAEKAAAAMATGGGGGLGDVGASSGSSAKVEEVGGDD